MRMLRYVSGTGGEAVELDVPSLSLGTACALRGRAWSYTLGYRGMSGLSRDAREVEVSATFQGRGVYDRSRRVFDRDVAMMTPGTLVWMGEWETAAYVVKSEPDAILHGTVEASMTFILVDGVWRKQVSRSFNPHAEAEDEYLDLPYDLPYDLGSVQAETEVQGPEWMPSPVRITIYGPASSPSVTIGGNTYSVDCDVPSGGYLVIDGLELTVTEVAADGTRTNRINEAEKGSGEGSGEYIFERIMPGAQPLSWPHSFGFDLAYWIEEGEPPCTW